jgi:hypothetical protein
VTKLPDIGELAIRRLDDEDDEAERVFMTEVAPHLPGIPKPRLMRAHELLEPAGLADLLQKPKRKRGNPNWKQRQDIINTIDFAVDDVHRLKGMPSKMAELVAAERYLRFKNGCCKIDEQGEVELHELVDKLQIRIHGSGTTGAERYRASRAK